MKKMVLLGVMVALIAGVSLVAGPAFADTPGKSFSPNEYTPAKSFSPHEPPVSVPEPATMILLGAGLVGLAGFSIKKFKK